MIILDACYDDNVNVNFTICPLYSFMDFPVVKALSDSLTPKGSLQVNIYYAKSPTMTEHKQVLSKFSYFNRCLIQRTGGNFVLGCSNQDIPKFIKKELRYKRSNIDEKIMEIFGGDYELIA